MISGRVIDEGGRPIRSARVVFIDATRSEQAVPARSNPYSDGKPFGGGKYILSLHQPGRYRIAVVPELDSAASGPAAGLLLPYYFPGVYDPAKAEWISVTPGDRKTIDFEPPALDGYPVEGVLAGLPPELAKDRFVASLATRTGYPFSLRRAPVDSGGRFHFDAAAPGEYTVLAADLEPGRYHGRENVVVSAGALRSVTVGMEPTATVHGRLIFPKGEQPDPTCFLGSVRLEPLDRVLGVSAFAAPPSEKDGTFTVEHVPQGRYRVSPRVDVCQPVDPEQIVQIRSATAKVTAVVTARAASVSVTAGLLRVPGARRRVGRAGTQRCHSRCSG